MIIDDNHSNRNEGKSGMYFMLGGIMLEKFTKLEQQIILKALQAVSDGAVIDPSEIHTRIGVYEEELQCIIDNFTRIIGNEDDDCLLNIHETLTFEKVDYAIYNCLREAKPDPIIWGHDNILFQYVNDIFIKWRDLANWRWRRPLEELWSRDEVDGNNGKPDWSDTYWLRLIDLLCKHPRTFTPTGSFLELSIWLHGFLAGSSQADTDADLCWERFTEWFDQRLDSFPSNYRIILSLHTVFIEWRADRSCRPMEDKDAFENLLSLFREFYADNK